jgi:hypothetical protein
MPEPSDTIDIAELPDEEGRCYIIGIDNEHSERMLTALAERLDTMFEKADYVVVGGNLGSESDVVLSCVDDIGIDDLDIDEVHKDTLKDAVMEDG